MFLLSVINRLLLVSKMANFHVFLFSLIVVINVTTASVCKTPNVTLIKENQAFNITCHIDIYDRLKWQKDDINIVPSVSNNIVLTDTKLNNNKGTIASLSVSKAHVHHSGLYRCTSFPKECQHIHHVFVLGANSIKTNKDFDNYKVLHLHKPLTLLCNVTNGPPHEIKWEKGGEMLTSNDRIKILSDKVEIQKALESDAGNYTCIVDFNIGSPNHLREEYFVIVRPTVWVPRTINIVEGERLFLNCSVSGVPTPSVKWEVANVTYEESSGRIILEEDKGIKNAILKIEETILGDRGTYKCIAENPANTTISEVFVRVKDKLAALWPFLGICAEVLILCTIILIYEKRRNKAELEESDTDQSPEQKNAPDMGKESDVRHRK